MQTNVSGITDGTDGLLPCPFCGEMPVALSSNGNMVAHACYTIGKEIRTTRSAWNTRVPMPDDAIKRVDNTQAVGDGTPSDTKQMSSTHADSQHDAHHDVQQQAERHDGTVLSHDSDGNDDGHTKSAAVCHYEQEHTAGNAMAHTADDVHSKHASIRTDGDDRLRMVHIVESHLGGIYVSQDDVSDIESACPQCGGRDRVLGSYDPHDAASHIAVSVCDALSDPDSNWLPSDGALSDYVIKMLTELSDFYDELHECDDILDSDKLDSHLIAWLVRDSCVHISNMFHSTGAPRCEEICEHIESTAADEMLARLSRQGVYCDGSSADDAMISAAVLSVVEARYENIVEREQNSDTGFFAYMLGATMPIEEDHASDIATAFIEAWIPPMILMPKDDDVWGRESSIARRIRRDARRLIERLCDGTGTEPNEVVGVISDFMSVIGYM